MQQRLVVGPFNRVEGDLEVQLDVSEGVVQSARVVAPMYRGFEQILLQRPAHDALVIAPRICGICSVSQSVAAARALAGAAGVSPPPNGRAAIDLMLACENAADHLAHFYLFFMPDFTREVYATRPWFAAAHERFAAMQGRHARRAVAERKSWLELMGTLGGKWPHTQSILPGGSSRAIESHERLRLLALVREFRAFLEDQLYAAPLESITTIADLEALDAWHEAQGDRGDFALWLTIARDLSLHRLGAGPGRLLSYGSFAGDAGFALAQGLIDLSTAAVQPLDPRAIAEDCTHAWLDDGGKPPRHPSEGLTLPQATKPEAYSWNKAPRWGGQVVETGALARQVLSTQPLARSAVAGLGCNVATRVLARLVELARLVPLAERLLEGLVPREPFHVEHALPEQAQGCGLVEAARGALGHWLTVQGGRIERYQIVAPTSWNFSPRDAAGTPGALEGALVGTPVAPGERTPVAVQHVVRSFDPCMVCTVH